MAVTLAVPFEVVSRAKADWDEAADTLDGSWRRLHRTTGAGLSTDVVAALEDFREPWVDELKACATRAQANSDEILLWRGTVVLADAEQAARVRALLPWVHHAADVAGR